MTQQLQTLPYLPSKHSFWSSSTINAVSLDGDDEVAVVLQELVRVERDDARLVRLRDVCEDNIYHSHQHAVLVGVTGVLGHGMVNNMPYCMLVYSTID